MTYIASDCFSLSPNSCTFFRKVEKLHDTPILDLAPRQKAAQKKLVKQFHNFQLSANAIRTLKNKVNWLYALSNKRHVRTAKGRNIHSFRMAFITFTLPAEQKTHTSDVTARLFNQLLTELRLRFKMENFVWRLEFQKNGNVHYHLATDTYLDYFTVLPIWNRILEKDSYVSDYRAKHSAMTLSDYCKAYSNGGKVPFPTLAKRYAKGRANNWSAPPSVSVNSVHSQKGVAFYLSKYVAKPSPGNPVKNTLDTEENSFALRLWFCSRSLSKVGNIIDYISHCDFSPKLLLESLSGLRHFFYKFVQKVTFDLSSSTGFARVFLEKLLRSHGSDLGYVPAALPPSLNVVL